MTRDDRDLLEVLKCELAFLERGGYHQSPRTLWKAPSVFLDSPACINFNDSRRSRPCMECCLIDMVPTPYLDEAVPCHFIPLNSEGETIRTLERQAHQPELEEAVRRWLKKTIARLEQQAAAEIH